MWNHRRSLVLSQLFVVIFMALLFVALMGAPWLVKWLQRFSANAQPQYYPLFLITLYTGGTAATVLLGCLYKLLHNISKEQLFVEANVRLMRLISWCCFFGAGVCLVSSLYYLPWLVVALAAGFAGLIVRVVKNLVDEAARLKEENDYTI